jgi:hypothetical protein
MGETVREQNRLTGDILTEDVLCAHIEQFHGGRARLDTTLFYKGTVTQQYTQEGTHNGVMTEDGPNPQGCPLSEVSP